MLKSILPLFRCLTAIERNVEQCQISISSPPADRVTIQFFCRHGRKHHENVTLQTSCRFRRDHRLLEIHPDLFKANYSLLNTRILSFYVIMFSVSSTTRSIANCQHLVAVYSSIVSSPVRYHQNPQPTLPGQRGPAGRLLFSPLSQRTEGSCQVSSEQNPRPDRRQLPVPVFSGLHN